MKKIDELLTLSRDILRGINQTVWGGSSVTSKAVKIVTSSVTGLDIAVGINFAAEDFCNDKVCFVFDVIGRASSTAGMVLGNILATKHLTTATTSITIVCRGVRYYCKNYGTFWGCTAAAKDAIVYLCKPAPGKGIEEGLKCVPYKK